MLTFCSSLFELINEALVIFKEQAQIINTIFQHSDTFYTHTEGKASHLLGVITTHAQYIGMHNTSAQNFQPARILANMATALTIADGAGNVNLYRRLSEWEIGRTQTNLNILAKHLLTEQLQSTFQVSKADVFINNKAFYLVEHGRMRCVIVAAINSTRANHTDRSIGFHALQGTCLYTRGLSTQQIVVSNIEGILHIQRRMIRGKI